MNILNLQPGGERMAPITENAEQERATLSFDIKEVYQIVRRNLYLIIGVLAVAIITGLIVTMLTTPTYKAVASIEIDQETQRILQSQEQQQPSFQDADRFLETQTDVIRSRTMAERVGQRLGLMGNPAFFAAMGEQVPDNFNAKTITPQAQRQTIGLIQSGLEVTLPQNSRVVQIAFYSPDASLAAKIANAYAQGFIEYNLERKFQSSSYARSFLAKQLADTKGRLETSERDLNNYARAAGLIKTSDAGSDSPTPPQSVTTSSLVQMNQAANVAETARINAQQKWETAQKTPVMSIPDVLSNSALQGMLQQRAQRESELSNMLTLHRADYPTVRTMQSQVTELNDQINTLAESIKTSIFDNFQASLKQEEAMKAQVSNLKGETLAEQDRGVRYNILAREADTNRTLYDGLLQRYKEVSAESGITSNNISVVDEAEAPSGPWSPNLLLNMALAILGGFAVAAGLVFVREQLDDMVRNPIDIENKLGLHVLGVVPRVAKSENLIDQLSQPRTPVSEAYHALRTSLMYSTADGLPKTLLVTSSRAAEGKSTTSFALAFDLARLGLKVVLVDTDMRRPSLHKLCDVPNELGLSSVLTHQSEVDGATISVELSTAQSPATVNFLPAGPIPPSPTELLGSPRMAEIVTALSQKFDVAVLDGPPVLGLADAPILSALTHATVLVIEANGGSRGATKSAVRRLLSGRGHLLGAILTKFDARKSGAAEYYEYDYYQYGSDDHPSDKE